eukprot:1582862-Karenia_brevis.AAC.1
MREGKAVATSTVAQGSAVGGHDQLHRGHLSVRDGKAVASSTADPADSGRDQLHRGHLSVREGKA